MRYSSFFFFLFVMMLALGCAQKEASEGGGVDPVEPSPCAEKVCGDPCSNCTDGEACPAIEEACNAAGECVAATGGLCDYDPCEGSTCGDVCTICNPEDPECVETAVEKACNEDGFCVANGPGLCESNPTGNCMSSDECNAGEFCTTDLDYCDACGSGGEMLSVCCGQCVSGPSGPCEGKTAGTCCDPCDGEDELCDEGEAMVQFACTEEGACLPLSAAVGPCEEEWDECLEEALADLCCCDGDLLLDPVCENGSWACPAPSEMFSGEDCWAEDGPCMLPPPPYEPCENKGCGDGCVPCDLEDPECQPEELPMVCNELGACVISGEENCPVFGDCMSNQDCGEDELCTAEYGECLPCADCPECTVCCGLCVEKTFDDQCVDQPCGATCEACAPGSHDCWSDQPHICNGDGYCKPEQEVVCEQPSDQCYSSGECGSGEICTVDLGYCDTCDDCPMCDVCCGDCIPAPADLCGEKECGDECNPCDSSQLECLDGPYLDFQCTDQGLCGWMGSAICVDNSVVGQCTEELPADPFTILEASISDDSLSLVIQYGGGCADHIFTGCFGSFMESFPVQVNLEIGHDANNDMCMALPVAFEEFDLSELKTAYQEGYQTENGSIIIHVAGWTESLTYTF